MAKKTDSKQAKISKVVITNDKISGRGGIFFFLRYIENIKIFALIENHIIHVKKSAKGLCCFQFLKQILAFFIDGSDMSVSSFDRRKTDKAYASILETTPEELASSHQIKKFFNNLQTVSNWVYRQILYALFIWRLSVEKPKIIILFGDTMVLDNDDAAKREGCDPTYKKKKGFQPMQISWGPYLVDAIFRSGSVHGNTGKDFVKSVSRLTKLIRKKYADVPIIVLTDSAFLDDYNFRYFEERLKILYICAGKQYTDLKQYVSSLSGDQFSEFCRERLSWQYVEFGNKLKSWSTFRRCIFTTLEFEEDGQMTFEFTRTDVFLYTNIGMDKELTRKLVQAGGAEYLNANNIIALNHSRGKGELNHRSLKEFAGKETLPFKRFGMNRAYYYFMVISHFLYEAYKRDAELNECLSTIYPNTFRRRFVDFAVKVISKGGQWRLKVTQGIYDNLNIPKLWDLSGSPPLVVGTL